MKPALVIAVLAVLSAVGLGQNTELPDSPSSLLSTFTLHASVLPVDCGNGCTVPATDIGWTLALLADIELRQDNILVPAVSVGFYGAGFNYYPHLARLMNRTVLPKNCFLPYFTAELGIVRKNPVGAPTTQDIAGVVGGGLLFFPKGNKKVAIKVGEVRWADWPGYNRGMILFSPGLNASF